MQCHDQGITGFLFELSVALKCVEQLKPHSLLEKISGVEIKKSVVEEKMNSKMKKMSQAIIIIMERKIDKDFSLSSNEKP